MKIYDIPEPFQITEYVEGDIPRSRTTVAIVVDEEEQMAWHKYFERGGCTLPCEVCSYEPGSPCYDP